MSASIQIKVNPNIYLRDPQETSLGKNIIKQGILLMDEIGLERFTFKKLAERIPCTEASIYRYFENKHFMLLYFLSWYWEWMRFRIDFKSMNVYDPKEKLKITIKTIIDTVRLSKPADYVNRDALNRLVIAEGVKAYHVKQVDIENGKGLFTTFEELNKKIQQIILAVNPNFPYPAVLAMTIMEMANNQIYYAYHLPNLTEINNQKGNLEQQVEEMIAYFMFKLIGE